MRPALWTAMLCLAALPLLAQPAPGGGPGRGPGAAPRQERNARMLGLTEPQRTAIQALNQKQRPALMAHMEAAQLAHQALAAALRDPQAKEATIRPLYEKASATRYEAMMAKRTLQLEVGALMTPEQRMKAARFRRMAAGGKGPGMMGPGMMGGGMGHPEPGQMGPQGPGRDRMGHPGPGGMMGPGGGMNGRPEGPGAPPK